MARMTKVRALLGVVFAIIILVVFAAFAAKVLGWNIPLLNDIPGPGNM
ncbi:MAG TPA: hypothetical protein PLJ71_12010 [Candidatus Hydrogenedentes bacterium]|nr:hypothetical protein [Candidatus Hydrogenedentota bacterium]HQM49402.1 hypothetical protein [Candidatus Hydrogenedentota bacterium]